MSELNPCPFCGSNKIGYSTKLKHYRGQSYIQACFYCEDCNAYGSRVLGDKFKMYSKPRERAVLDKDVKEKAKEMWNRRV